MSQNQTVIPQEFNLPAGVRPVTGLDGIPCLELATQMTTLYWQTYGEQSRFFQALIEGRLIGAKCPQCQMVLVPPMTWNCPDCGFTDMEEVVLPHHGLLAATAPITIFPPAGQHGNAPYARGYVDVAVDVAKASFLPARLITTTGLPRPGIFVKGVKLKLVFKDEREGRITDIFWVPWDEIPEGLRDIEPLLASQLQFEDPKPPVIKRPFEEVFTAVRDLAVKAVRSPRAVENLKAVGTRRIGVWVGGGEFTLSIQNGCLEVKRVSDPGVDFVIQADDPNVFLKWANGGSLSDPAAEGSLWLPNTEAFGILPALDRVPRSVRRDEGEGKLSPES